MASSSLSRRRFLSHTAAAGALPLVMRSARADSPNDRPVFATIGLRNQGWSITEKSVKFADFAALADVDTSVLATNIGPRKATPTTVRSSTGKISTRS
jgi:hypothetical protein